MYASVVRGSMSIVVGLKMDEALNRSEEVYQSHGNVWRGMVKVIVKRLRG